MKPLFFILLSVCLLIPTISKSETIIYKGTYISNKESENQKSNFFVGETQNKKIEAVLEESELALQFVCPSVGDKSPISIRFISIENQDMGNYVYANDQDFVLVKCAYEMQNQALRNQTNALIVSTPLSKITKNTDFSNIPIKCVYEHGEISFDCFGKVKGEINYGSFSYDRKNVVEVAAEPIKSGMPIYIDEMSESDLQDFILSRKIETILKTEK